MDPTSTASQWQWHPQTTPTHRDLIPYVLWVCELDGPFQSESGDAPKQLRAALKGRRCRYTADTSQGQTRLYYVLKELEDNYPEAIEVERLSRKCFLIAGKLDRDQLPPNPFPNTQPTRRVETVDVGPVKVTDLAQQSVPVPTNGDRPQGPLNPTEALEAIRVILGGSLGTGAKSPEVLALEAEVEHLKGVLDVQGATLLQRTMEVELLRRAIAQGQTVNVG